MPGVVKALEELLADATAGDPMSSIKWTHRSLRSLRKGLRRRGFRLSEKTIARLMRLRHYSLRTNRKRLAGTRDPRRERQFRHLMRLRKLYITLGLPVISVDTKKKELVGNFKNPGRAWRKEAREVLDHDFPRWGKGHAHPYGIYDVAHNDGYVVVGASHDTSFFAAAALRRWWQAVGRRRYPKVRRLLIEADGGGSNDCRRWEWKVALQNLADETGLILTVTHYPPGASKWNPIEHRMFSLISENWAAEPLSSYAKILTFIRRTRSSKGFHCRACLDTTHYPTGYRVNTTAKKWVRLKPHPVLPQWNYTIWPHGAPRKC